MILPLTGLLAVWAWFAAPALAAQSAGEEVFVTTGEHGEVSFSDEPRPGSERVIVETAEPAHDALAEMERRIQQTLMVANALEESRLARERARAEARAAARREAQAPPVVVQERYVTSPYLSPGYRHKPDWDRPGYDGRDRHRDARGGKDERRKEREQISRPMVWRDEPES